MRKLSIYVIGAVAIIGLCSAALQAATIPFRLDGNAGSGLLPGNENPAVVEPSTGGIGAGGISFDTVSKVLSIDVQWGSSNGFTDLTGDVLAMHIHLRTDDPAPDGFSQNAPAIIFLHPLVGFNSSATSGSFIGVTPGLSASAEAALLGSQSYINVHTSAHGGGEIRGHLVAIPEPATFVLAVFALLGLFGCGRRWRRG